MMKKILIGLLMFLFVIDVSAKDKTFIIEEINHQYYYEEHSTVDFFQEEIKMDELKTYSDTIQIMNNSDSSREVFLLFESKGEDGSYDDLMDYLHLKIYLNDKEVYNDSAETQNLASKHEDLHDFISIGKIKEKDLSTLKIEMNVSEEYKNISDNQFAYVSWSFYQKDKDNDFVEIEELTPALMYNFLDVWVFCGVCVLFAVLLLSLYLYRQKTKYKREAKKQEKEEKEKEKEEKK